jgi:sporulation protein YlmC with PRC-barrel domain
MSTRSLADLIGSKVIAADGSHLGGIVDVVVSEDGSFRLVELVIGRRGWIERLNMANVVRPHDSGDRSDRISWTRIDRIEGPHIYLKPHTE